MVVDALAARGGAGPGREEADAWVTEARVGGEDVLLVKPLTFMNRSGVAVDALLAARGGSPSDVVAVVDDAALELGELRVRERGSHGGHNGLRSLIEVLGTEELRLRLPAAHPSSPQPERDVVRPTVAVSRSTAPFEPRAALARGRPAEQNAYRSSTIGRESSLEIHFSPKEGPCLDIQPSLACFRSPSSQAARECIWCRTRPPSPLRLPRVQETTSTRAAFNRLRSAPQIATALSWRWSSAACGERSTGESPGFASFRCPRSW
jgi:peptidyl-tRNA hydrolase